MTRIAWASDIHFDFADSAAREEFYQQVYSVNAEALLLTGDLANAAAFPAALVEIHESVKVPVYYVLGNHDFYGSNVRFVREAVQGWNPPGITYLTNASLLDMGSYHLCGVDGWGDMRNGNAKATRVVLADYHYIDDLKYKTQEEIVKRLNQLGREDAQILKSQLESELRHETIVVATHVPPYPGAAWHKGKTSDEDWQPNFTCRAVGDTLDRAAKTKSDVRHVVFCGHSHSRGTYDRRANLRVYTAESEYRSPQVQGVFDGGSFQSR